MLLKKPLKSLNTTCMQRLRGQEGFSLPELMAVMVIMLLAAMLVSSGIPVAQKAYVSAVDRANSEAMLSTVTSALRDQLAVADPATIHNGTDNVLVTFTSTVTGCEVSIENTGKNSAGADVDGLFVREITRDPLSGDINHATTNPLVPEKIGSGSYDTRLTVKIGSSGSITGDPATGVFTVKDLQVFRGNSSDPFGTIPEFKVRTVKAP